MSREIECIKHSTVGVGACFIDAPTPQWGASTVMALVHCEHRRIFPRVNSCDAIYILHTHTHTHTRM